MLLVGDRVVLRSNAPPDAEYLLFEIADIELRASEPGRVREHGYQTTASRARARLAQVGITAGLARACAVAAQPVIATAYARGPGVRHIAGYLGPLELFQADTYDATGATYHGVFLDLPQLAADLGIDGAGPLLQAVYLAALLEAEEDDTTVFLSTDTWTKHRKPGERTHRRPALSDPAPLPVALAALAAGSPKPDIQEQLARADVIAFIRARADASNDEEARGLYASLERAIAVREMPDRGPLAEPELWAIETRLDLAQLDNIFDAVEEAERTRGRTPGTTYLRARASLALSLEPPKLIAERVSALALSMTSFQELCLLAAEAWLDAGEPRRAMPYARDLVDAPGVDEGLLLRAKRILARAVGAAPERAQMFVEGLPAAAMPPRTATFAPPPMPPVSVPSPDLVAQSWPPAKSRVPTEREEPTREEPVRPATSPGMGALGDGGKQAPTLDAPMRPAGLPAPRATSAPPVTFADPPRASAAARSSSRPGPPPLPQRPSGPPVSASRPSSPRAKPARSHPPEGAVPA
ncbi:MAG: Basic proline-rich protein precursor, partial [Labilithrix sp.]|nr:Basic proline-rich protein precursor [Labilithrix sp.]